MCDLVGEIGCRGLYLTAEKFLELQVRCQILMELVQVQQMKTSYLELGPSFFVEEAEGEGC